jgi:hypothetical protein
MQEHQLGDDLGLDDLPQSQTALASGLGCAFARIGL